MNTPPTGNPFFFSLFLSWQAVRREVGTLTVSVVKTWNGASWFTHASRLKSQSGSKSEGFGGHWIGLQWIAVCFPSIKGQSAVARHCTWMRAKQLNKLSPPSLLYANNYYSSLDSFIFCLFLNLCFPGLFCPPLAPQILRDTFFILIDFDSCVIDLMWSSCFSGVTDATFAMAMACPSPSVFPWKWILSSPFQSFTSLPCFFIAHFIYFFSAFCLPRVPQTSPTWCHRYAILLPLLPQ